MSKRVIALATAVAVAMSASLFAFAETSPDGLFTYTLNDDGEVGFYVSVTSYEGAFEGDVTIPDELGGYPVTDFRGDFSNAQSEGISGGLYTTHIGTLTLPKHLNNFRITPGVIAAERYAAAPDADCVSVDETGALYSSDGSEFYVYPAYSPAKEYRIADTATTVYEPGSYSKYLERIYIPGSVKTIPQTSFTYAQALREVFLEEGVETIDDNCTGVCPAMERFVMPSTLTSIGVSGLSGLAKAKELVIPAAVESIGSYGLSDNAELERLVFLGFPESVGAYVFLDDPALTDVYFAGTEDEFNASSLAAALPAGVTAHFGAVYADASGVKLDFDGSNLSLDGNITDGTENSLFAWDFYRSDMQTLMLGENTRRIGEWAFHDCDSLEEIVVSGADVTVAANAFSGCGSLRTIIAAGNISFAPGTLPDGVLVYAPAGSTVTGAEDVAYYSYSDGVLTLDGGIYTDAYGFLDAVAVMCAGFGEITRINVSELHLNGVSFYYYDEAGKKHALEQNTLRDGTIEVGTTVNGEDVKLSFNELCGGIADGSLTSFYFATSTEAHGDNIDTPVKISFAERIIEGVRRVLSAIVTLLNRLFRLLKSLGGK
ncbi:MAG: leucine-rich repeat domain-containing protein [Clostridia bacterium]|nr:leucine-rich repeat domain-containing protein [Clostridia bacterium]